MYHVLKQYISNRKSGFDSIYQRKVEGEDISLRGALTGTSVRMLDGSHEQVTAMYYDRNGRVVQSRSNNHLGGYDKYYFRYDFTGAMLKQRHEHKVANQTQIVENYTYEYDNKGRPTTTLHAINSHTPIKIRELQYDEACRVKKKILHGNMYATDYTYNLHSRLKSISSPQFSQTIRRHDGNTRQYYNGNISEIDETMNGISFSTRYDYDDLKRLVQQEVYNHSNPVYSKILNTYTRYDRNGNIVQMNRNAWIMDFDQLDHEGYPAERVDRIDSLSYSYKGNQIDNVFNVYGTQFPYYSHTPAFDYGYKSPAFIYDANGNQMADAYRNVAWTKYNQLNRPMKIQRTNGNKTEYLYDAAGVKRKIIETTPLNPMQIPLGSTGNESVAIKTTNTTDYCANFSYYNGVLQHIFTSEGYIQADNVSTANWKHIYNVKDYQGNVRMELASATLANPTTTTYTKQNLLTYYSFGHKGTPGNSSPSSNALFQYGSNMVSKGSHTMDFHFRQLDTQLGRFTSIDPLAALEYHTSPYAYCSNDPINYVDPLGLMKGLTEDDPIELPEVEVVPDNEDKYLKELEEWLREGLDDDSFNMYGYDSSYSIDWKAAEKNRETNDKFNKNVVNGTGQSEASRQTDEMIKNREYERLSFTVKELDSLNWTVVYRGQNEIKEY